MLTESERQVAAGVSARFRADCDSVRAERGLTAAQRNRKLAQAKVSADAQMAQIKAKSDAREALREEALERALFRANGQGGGRNGSRSGRPDAFAVVAARDAADRAAELTSPGEAMEMLVQATRRGDDSLATAVMRQAFEMSHSQQLASMAEPWRGVVEMYCSAYPAREQAIADLDDIMTARTDRQAVMNDGAYLSVPYPPELPHNDPSIQNIANGEGIM